MRQEAGSHAANSLPSEPGGMFLTPSVELERRTRALDCGAWGIAALISAFTGTLAMLFIGIMVPDISGIVSTVFNDRNGLIMILWVIICMTVFATGLCRLGISLRTSYCIDGSTVIRGRIGREALKIREDPGKDLMTRGTLTSAAVLSLLRRHVNAMYGTVAAQGLMDASRLIRYNRYQPFVEVAFGTEIYRKKRYDNVRYVRESRRRYFFGSDNGRFSIPKIYEGLPERLGSESPEGEGKRIVKRALIRSAAVIVIVAALLTADDIAGAVRNRKIIETIDASAESVEGQISSYGYTLKNGSAAASYQFAKSVTLNDGTRGSNKITVRFDRRGNVSDCNVDIFLPDASYVTEAEYALSLMPWLSDEDMEYIIERLQSGIGGGGCYVYLRNGTQPLTVGTSHGTVELAY